MAAVLKHIQTVISSYLSICIWFFVLEHAKCVIGPDHQEGHVRRGLDHAAETEEADLIQGTVVEDWFQRHFFFVFFTMKLLDYYYDFILCIICTCKIFFICNSF